MVWNCVAQTPITIVFDLFIKTIVVYSHGEYAAIFGFLTFSMEKTDKKWYTIFVCVKR